MNDEEMQADELLALASIYDEHPVKRDVVVYPYNCFFLFTIVYRPTMWQNGELCNAV